MKYFRLSYHHVKVRPKGHLFKKVYSGCLFASGVDLSEALDKMILRVQRDKSTVAINKYLYEVVEKYKLTGLLAQGFSINETNKFNEL